MDVIHDSSISFPFIPYIKDSLKNEEFRQGINYLIVIRFVKFKKSYQAINFAYWS